MKSWSRLFRIVYWFVRSSSFFHEILNLWLVFIELLFNQNTDLITEIANDVLHIFLFAHGFGKNELILLKCFWDRAFLIYNLDALVNSLQS